MPSHITCLSTDSSRSLIAIGKNTGIVEIYNYPTFTSLGLYISIESPIRSIHFMDNNGIYQNIIISRICCILSEWINKCV